MASASILDAWTPSSWRTKPIAQDVVYPNQAELNRATDRLKQLPGLVTPFEIEKLRKQLADVADGKAFLLQSGDCAELFTDCVPSKIDAKVKLSLLMSLILIWGGRLPVVRVGRIAGQYAKPRSKATEVVKTEDGEQVEVLTFRGDNVNAFQASASARRPDPERLLQSYFHSCATLNHIRASLGSGIADLHAPQSWSLAHVRSPALQREFSSVIESLEDALHFMQVVGADRNERSLESVDYYTSHEGLMLEYEESLTRGIESSRMSKSKLEAPNESTRASHYALSAHTLWLGDRTRQLDGAHVEYFRGLINPIGVKVGPSMKPGELVDLLAKVDPLAEKGRCTLICRFGAGKAPSLLPPLIQAVRSSPHANSVIWCSDPMHGNTRSSPLDPSIKTRRFGDVVTELVESLQVHAAERSRLAGVHLELTGEVNAKGESVTECVGGSMELSDEDLGRRYLTHCDPRLNYEQSLDVAFLLSHSLRSRRLGRSSSASRSRTREPSPTSSPIPPSDNAQNGVSHGDKTHPSLLLNEDEDSLLKELVRGISNRS
ncbi:phospho-2-dehydro-3-deoxyheptonate aldolase [Ceraceosorus guamensis]|uniref:Phospho-2-dehydro-3-deoxyheptonate aldolase n=1 Tax=Ceraceosorus guamensis TaxID=1522189 RepID=A0A316W6W4_9BASI|nr:phospho-2-dehydro-3-deoxyheptonate aldolase [Ceraceosorus guamensis]PWN45532.1 phospho-2-dehydro-3-deoxyheptonate aldolase [Ceraceosorus guamensis]